MKKFMIILLSILLFSVSFGNVVAVSMDNIISEIKAGAENDKYRFMLADKHGITSQLKESLAQNDQMYLDDNPIGSVKIVVIDAYTGKTIDEAQCLFSFATRRSLVSLDGTATQTSNPFLLFDLGKTDNNGEITFLDTYFYKTARVNPGDAPYAISLQVSLANIADSDPLISIDYSAQTYLSSSEEVIFKKVLNNLGGRKQMKFSELKASIKAASNEKYNEIARGLFNSSFVAFSDAVIVKIGDQPQFKKLIDEGKQELSIGELREYIDENRDLFEKYIASRYYEDFAGFTPTFVIKHEPEYESTITYKDGTVKPRFSNAYLGVSIFDGATGGTGHAIDSNAFSYRAYIYADGYMQGRAIGATIRQDLVDRNITRMIYLSKDYPPVVVPDRSNAVFGILKDADNKPIPSATIQILDTGLRALTTENGYFSFTSLKNEKLKLGIIDPQNGEPMEARVIYKDQEYPLDNIPIILSGENQVFQITLIGGTGEKGGFSSWLLILIIILIVILILVLFFFLIMNKKRVVCKSCKKKIEKNDKMCRYCGQPVE